MMKSNATAAIGSFTVAVALSLLSLPGCGAKEVADPASPVPAAAPGAPAASACTKDTDCKGDRICTRGACVDPNAK